jgi:hypothetical protein
MKCSAWTWRLASLVSVTLLVLACGGSREVETLGQDTYRTSARGYHSEAQTRALDRASAHCQGMGREMLITELDSVAIEPGFYRATLTFRCLEPGHPELHDTPAGMEPR